tara:strand:+ start:2145 stop:3098 length:954 start_codon:yes stop_codon:yes gene_type:complete
MDYKDPIEVAKQLLAEENEAVVDVVEAETILDLDDEQDTEGKKTKLDIGKGTEGKDKKNKASLNMKPSSASAKVEGAPSMTKEHLDALFTGEELSEDFKEKASTIFEAAISERAAQVELALNEQFEIAISEAVEGLQKEVTERLDDYLGYVVEEWMKENELAVESGIRTEVAESFIHGLRELFESSYIDVPEEQYDLVDGLSTEVEDLREKLDAAINENIETTKEKDLAECSLVFEEETEGMLETDIDRLRTLAEGIEFDSVDQFREKLNILKESYSENSNTLTEETDVTTPDEGTEESISPMMEAYTRALRNPLTK